ncbi:MAG: type II secretion system F family protein [Sedimentisphaerales bacterium]|nr:type II secretion system F family protein [Sedimentisphaerales bacterium]
MAIYEYTARDETGAVFNGVYEDINSVSALKSELAKIDCRLVRAKKRGTGFTTGKGGIKEADIVAFTFKFAGMCGAGLTIIQCLETLENQIEKGTLKIIIGDIKRNVQNGSSLKDAFGKYRQIFSDFFLGMIEAGEAGGKLTESLEISAQYLEKKAELSNKIKSAFVYPIIVLVMSFLVITALIIFVVPTFTKIYKQLGVPLPFATRVLVFFNLAVTQWWPVLIGVAIGTLLLIKYLKKSPSFKRWWDYSKYRLPIFGKLNKLTASSGFIRSFAMLISTGVPIIKAFHVAGIVVSNEKMSEISVDLQKSVQAGNGVADSLRKHDVFPPIISQLASSGEQAGVLALMLNKGVDFMDKDIERMLNSLLIKLEPILTLGTGAIIGLILLAVYMPMFDYMSHLK